jgi:hypothetical protein
MHEKYLYDVHIQDNNLNLNSPFLGGGNCFPFFNKKIREFCFLSASSNHFAIFLLKSYPKKEKEKQ